MCDSVTHVGILGFPKVEIERKPQRSFQTDFIKLVLEHGEAAQRKGRFSELAQGPSSAWLLSTAGDKVGLHEKQAF